MLNGISNKDVKNPVVSVQKRKKFPQSSSHSQKYL